MADFPRVSRKYWHPISIQPHYCLASSFIPFLPLHINLLVRPYWASARAPWVGLSLRKRWLEAHLSLQTEGEAGATWIRCHMVLRTLYMTRVSQFAEGQGVAEVKISFPLCSIPLQNRRIQLRMLSNTIWSSRKVKSDQPGWQVPK
jgi:hypothetical protein